MYRIGPWALVSSALVAVAACGTPSSRFLSDSAEHTYFKVPRSYTVYDLPTGRADRLSPDAPEEVELLWSKGFDASADPDPVHVQAAQDFRATVDDPVGVANIYEVQGSYNQKLSLTTVRAVPLGVDPLFVQDSEKDLVEIITYEPIQQGDGIQGSRVLFNLRPSSDEPWRTYDMITLFDPGRYRMYTFTIGCSAPCFKDRLRELRDITSSWRVTP